MEKWGERKTITGGRYKEEMELRALTHYDVEAPLSCEFNRSPPPLSPVMMKASLLLHLS